MNRARSPHRRRFLFIRRLCVKDESPDDRRDNKKTSEPSHRGAA
jgi:hypothetical protein